MLKGWRQLLHLHSHQKINALGPRRAFPLQSPRLRVGLAVLVLLILLAMLAPVVSPYNPIAMDVGPLLEPPSLAHPFGTDNFGRDILSRVLHGSRSSLPIAAAAVILATVVGVPLGLLAGFFGRVLDTLIMRAMDILLAFPSLILAISVIAFLGPGETNVVLALGVVYIPRFARLARSGVLTVRELPYVQAARAIGDDSLSIMVRQILPNIFAPILVQITLMLAYGLLTEAGLSFLGLGTQPPAPSWGRMLSEARSMLEQAPWTVVYPGAFIMLAVIGFNLLGDGLRDALDPRLRDIL